ncbi:MAG: hypothetical protein ACJ78Q_00410 [Chloroflexia bacterium]
MSSDRAPGGSTRRILSMAAIVVGALLLLVMPGILLFYAVTGNKNAELPGTIVILTATGGIGLIIIGAALRE